MYIIPEQIARQVMKLQHSNNPVVVKVATLPGHTERIAKWSVPIYLHEPMNLGKEMRRLSWA